MGRRLDDLIWVVRCDLQQSANDLRLSILPAYIALVVLALSGGALLLAFEQEFVRGYAFVHGLAEQKARALIELKYFRALTGLAVLSLCLIVNRFYFLLLCLLAAVVLGGLASDYSSIVQLQYSESRFEEYLQRYGVELWSVSVLFRLSFLVLLVWAAKDVRAYHLARPRV